MNLPPDSPVVVIMRLADAEIEVSTLHAGPNHAVETRRLAPGGDFMLYLYTTDLSVCQVDVTRAIVDTGPRIEPFARPDQKVVGSVAVWCAGHLWHGISDDWVWRRDAHGDDVTVTVGVGRSMCESFKVPARPR